MGHFKRIGRGRGESFFSLKEIKKYRFLNIFPFQEKKMDDSLLKKVSLERLSNPEQIDQLMKIRSPSGWIIVIAVLLLLSVGCGWLFLGKVPVTMPCNGNIMPTKGLAEVQSTKSFVVEQVNIHSGIKVYRNEVLLKGVLPDSEEEYLVKAPYDGVITDVYVREGAVVLPGKSLVRIEPVINSGVEDLCAVMYISVDDSVRLKGREDAFISPSGISFDRYGYIRGYVETVSRYPEGEQQQIAVRIKFNPSLNGTLDYTYGKTPDETPKGGTPCTGYIQLGYEKPIEMFLPWLVGSEE